MNAPGAHFPYNRSKALGAGTTLAAFLALIDLTHRVHESVVVECRKATGLTPEQVLTLWRIDLSGGAVTMSELAEILGRANHTATHLVDRLEPRGLVIRSRGDGGDGRRVFVSLTDTGRTELERCHEILADIVAKTFGLTGDEDAARRISGAIETLEELLGE